MNEFMCFLSLYLALPYHKVYTLSIFYHLNELLFPSFFLKLPPWSCYEIFKFPTKPMIMVGSHIKSGEKDLNQWK